jgi:BirA family biotin operon repressor/biotin-[acetyl-CoA-carboxylase] ligase
MAAMTGASDQDASWTDAADPARRVGHAVEYHAEIGSTNDRAREALTEPGGPGRVIVADLQTEGRGRRGRTWTSPSGVNLMASVGIVPGLPARDAGWLGAAVALATRGACTAVAQPAGRLSVRWPNDIVAADGAKVAGLLLETSMAEGELTEAIIGIGINVNWWRRDMPPEIAAGATSLADLSGEAVDRVELLAALLDALDEELTALERGDSPVPRLREVSWLDGRQVDIELGEDRISGTVAGLADDGSLLLDAPDGRVALAIGEVVRVEPVAPEPAPEPAGSAA